MRHLFTILVHHDQKWLSAWTTHWGWNFMLFIMLWISWIVFFYSEIEAKHLQLSVNQIDKSFSDYSESNATNLIESSSTNTSRNSTLSSTSSSSNRSCSKIPKINRVVKQNKYSPIKTDPSTNVTENYSTTLSYNTTDDAYYSSNPSMNYSNLSLYASNYSNSSCFSTLNNSDDSFYYECQQKKRMRLEHDHSRLTPIESESNFYSSTPTSNHCYMTINNYSNEHSHHPASVIVDSQQYFLNGWNGGTAAFW